MTKHTAIALCRVSTKKQRLEGASLEAQEVRVYECASYLDAHISKLWSLDTSSRKGNNIARKDLHAMFEYAKQDKSINYIIVDEADRFMRSVSEAYWWKIEFQRINVTLAYANMPEITHEDNPMAVMREMMAFFQAEVSNHERITKTTDKMQAKIQAGYYPGMVHQGYKKSDVRSLHVPREPQWSLLQMAMRKVIYEEFTLSEVLEWLNNNGYRLLSGNKLDMYKLSRIFKQPYYAGIIRMSNWDVVCQNGLHKPMITVKEHERLLEIVTGRGKKFAKHHFNPLFLASNIIECSDCVKEDRKEARLVGYRHHNNKPERTRRWYERYRCRSYGKNILKSVLHDQLDKVFEDTELIIDDKGLFISSMRQVWQTEVASSIEVITRLKQRLSALSNEKDRLVRTMANNPDMADDFKGSINTIKAEIESTEQEINKASNIESDFDEFIEFSLDYVERLKDNWWGAENSEERIRLKQLIYPRGLTVSRQGKVLTPALSPIYRYRSSKKTSENVFLTDLISTGGPAGT